MSKADGVASVSLNHRPVNALTQGVCEELRQCLGELEADPQMRGLLLGSARPGPADVQSPRAPVPTLGSGVTRVAPPCRLMCFPLGF